MTKADDKAPPAKDVATTPHTPGLSPHGPGPAQTEPTIADEQRAASDKYVQDRIEAAKKAVKP